MAPVHVKLDRPIAPSAMSDENIAEAFKAIAGLPQFESDQTQVTLQTEFGEHPSSPVDAVAALPTFFRSFEPFLTAKLTILREKKVVVFVEVHRIKSQLTTFVDAEFGVIRRIR